LNKLLFALFFAVILGASASGFSMAGGGSSEGDLSKAGGERLFTVAKDFLKPVFAFRFSNEGGRVSVDRVVLYDSFLQKQGGSGDFTMELRNSRKQPVFSAKFSFTKTVLSDSPECFGSASGVLDGGSGGCVGRESSVTVPNAVLFAPFSCGVREVVVKDSRNKVIYRRQLDNYVKLRCRLESGGFLPPYGSAVETPSIRPFSLPGLQFSQVLVAVQPVLPPSGNTSSPFSLVSTDIGAFSLSKQTFQVPSVMKIAEIPMRSSSLPSLSPSPFAQPSPVVSPLANPLLSEKTFK